jgi:uncharacterized peroxidase-related enzyme
MTNFTAYNLENATEERLTLLSNIQKAYGFIPNLFAYMVEAPVAVEAYLALNKFISQSSLTPSQAQLALLTVSRENECDFCSTAHRGLAKKMGVKIQSIEAVLNGGLPSCSQDAALVQFVRLLVQKRGWLSEQDTDDFLKVGFTKQQIFELMLVLAIKTLSNYTNHLTHPQPNPEFLAML